MTYGVGCKLVIPWLSNAWDRGWFVSETEPYEVNCVLSSCLTSNVSLRLIEWRNDVGGCDLINLGAAAEGHS